MWWWIEAKLDSQDHLSILEVEETSSQLELETSQTSQNETWHTLPKSILF